MAKRILFQGDSITDCGRNRDDFYSMGMGYANLAQISLGMEYPGEFEFVNRGINGNRIVDLYGRLKEDFLDLEPDYASIYIGINDAWHEVVEDGADTEEFERIYIKLLDEVKAACPKTKLMLVAPFVLNCNPAEDPKRFAIFKKDVEEKVEVVKKIGAKYGIPVVELQAAFDEACTKVPAKYWSAEGVHPTIYGHEIIKRLWLETFEKIK